MTTLKFIGIFVFIFALGVLAAWGIMELRHPKEPLPLIPEYIEYCGFKKMQNAYVYPQYQVSQENDTILRSAVIVPVDKAGRTLYLFGFARDKNWVAVDALYTEDDLNRWIEFLKLNHEIAD